MQSTLPEWLIELLVEMHGETNPATKCRWKLRELAVYASDQVGREVSHMAVHRAIRPILDERAAMASDALRLKINEKIAGQVDTLDDLMTKVGNDAATATPMARRKGLDAFRKALDSKLRVSGVAQRVEVKGQMDHTSGGEPMRFYLPSKRDLDADDAGQRPEDVASE